MGGVRVRERRIRRRIRKRRRSRRRKMRRGSGGIAGHWAEERLRGARKAAQNEA